MNKCVKLLPLAMLFTSALAVDSATPATHPALIPAPANIEWRPGSLSKDATPRVVHMAGLPAEGYELEITTAGAVIRSSTDAGTFYAQQTVKQLRGVDGSLPCGLIRDAPRFVWRGLLLDEARHFQGKAFVKRTIDFLAYHKMNVLHWHLTDDQGWRIEIKKYPKLTEIGAWREQGNGKRYGGFYTQDEIREVVAYAASRHITVVPEIEMPGHALGALSAYPEFSCTGGPFKVRTAWGIEETVFCAGNEATFAFLQDVLAEVLTLFPSTFIHIGGDECPKVRWHACPKCQARIKAEGLKNEHELQSYFIRRIESFLDPRGRRLIGWDEILEGGLPPKATVMSWRGMGGAQAAAQSGHDYVATPTSHCYLDYSLGQISLEKAYSLNPIPSALTSEQQRHCLGVQGNIWGERTPTAADVERMTWPRLCALAEVGWSSPAGRNFADFNARLTAHADRLAAMGLVISVPAPVAGKWIPSQMSLTFKTLDWTVTPHISGAGDYDVELAYTRGQHGVVAEWVALLQDGVEVARDTHESFAGGKPKHPNYRLKLPAIKAGAVYTLRVSLRSDGGTDSFGDIRMRRK